MIPTNDLSTYRITNEESKTEARSVALPEPKKKRKKMLPGNSSF